MTSASAAAAASSAAAPLRWKSHIIFQDGAGVAAVAVAFSVAAVAVLGAALAATAATVVVRLFVVPVVVVLGGGSFSGSALSGGRNFSSISSLTKAAFLFHRRLCLLSHSDQFLRAPADGFCRRPKSIFLFFFFSFAFFLFNVYQLIFPSCFLLSRCCRLRLPWRHLFLVDAVNFADA